MSLFMDIHNIEGGVSAADVAEAHKADLETQAKYGVSYLRYWHRGAGRVIGRSGTAVVHMRATLGQEGIIGLPALGAALWHEMKDPLTSIVRIEIAYHGQAEDAGSRSDVKTWLSDF